MLYSLQATLAAYMHIAERKFILKQELKNRRVSVVYEARTTRSRVSKEKGRI
jgi:hypothetical protein